MVSLGKILILFAICIFVQPVHGDDSRWWPQQKAPKSIVRLSGLNGPAEGMLAQSISGLAAQAVNQGRFDEMVWIEDNRPDYKQWYNGLKQRLNFKDSGTCTVWELVKRYANKGIIKGYVLYSYSHDNKDISSNVATAAAGQLQGVMIEAGQELKAKKLGLKRLLDARGKNSSWCFERFKNQFNRKLLLAQNPAVPNMRDMAIAHKCMVLWGANELFEKVLKWLEPGTPIMGWNSGDEMGHVGPVSRWGHFQTASDFALNVPILSAGNENAEFRQLIKFEPAKIDYSSKGKYVSFLMSDGDNVQWLMGAFAFNKNFWANPKSGTFPMGWSACIAQLSQVCPEAIDYIASTQPSNASIIEFGGGYYYPDLFARDRGADRINLLRDHARRVSAQMKRTGAKTLCFICQDINSPAAHEAYKVYANEIDGLVGMIAMQYYPYNGGNGRVFWVKNKNGIEIPVLTPKYAIWERAGWNNAGSPEKVVRMINTVPGQIAADYSLVAVNAWSRFKGASDVNEHDKDPNIQSGLAPVACAIEQFEKTVRIITPEEMLWRIRMEHDTQQTMQIILQQQGRL